MRSPAKASSKNSARWHRLPPTPRVSSAHSSSSSSLSSAPKVSGFRRVPGWPVYNCTLGACSTRERASSMYNLVFSSELGVFSFSMFETGTCSL